MESSHVQLLFKVLNNIENISKDCFEKIDQVSKKKINQNAIENALNDMLKICNSLSQWNSIHDMLSAIENDSLMIKEQSSNEEQNSENSKQNEFNKYFTNKKNVKKELSDSDTDISDSNDISDTSSDKMYSIGKRKKNPNSKNDVKPLKKRRLASNHDTSQIVNETESDQTNAELIWLSVSAYNMYAHNQIENAFQEFMYGITESQLLQRYPYIYPRTNIQMKRTPLDSNILMSTIFRTNTLQDENELFQLRNMSATSMLHSTKFSNEELKTIHVKGRGTSWYDMKTAVDNTLPLFNEIEKELISTEIRTHFTLANDLDGITDFDESLKKKQIEAEREVKKKEKKLKKKKYGKPKKKKKK